MALRLACKKCSPCASCSAKDPPLRVGYQAVVPYGSGIKQSQIEKACRHHADTIFRFTIQPLALTAATRKLYIHFYAEIASKLFGRQSLPPPPNTRVVLQDSAPETGSSGRHEKTVNRSLQPMFSCTQSYTVMWHRHTPNANGIGNTRAIGGQL